MAESDFRGLMHKCMTQNLNLEDTHTHTHTPHHTHTTHKLTFKEHINYMSGKCTKLIFALSKSAKLNWGLQLAALKTIHTGAILPLLLYGAPIWHKAIDTANNKLKLIRVQRLINIRQQTHWQKRRRRAQTHRNATTKYLKV